MEDGEVGGDHVSTAVEKAHSLTIDPKTPTAI